MAGEVRACEGVFVANPNTGIIKMSRAGRLNTKMPVSHAVMTGLVGIPWLVANEGETTPGPKQSEQY